MAYDSGTAPSVIGKTEYETMTKLIPQCQEKIMKCNEDPENNPCDQAYSACMESQVEPVTATGVNPYDLRVPCGDEQFCYNFTLVFVFLYFFFWYKNMIVCSKKIKIRKYKNFKT